MSALTRDDDGAGDLGDQVAGAIFELRQCRVMFDADIAAFFGTSTRAVNQYRKRNQDRFSADYAFELSKEEWASLRSQDVISDKLKARRYRPWAYTEHGFTMLSMGMKGPRAAAIAHVVIDTFVKYRQGRLPVAPVLGGANAGRDRRQMIDAFYAQMQSLAAMPLPTGSTLGGELETITGKAITRVKAMVDAPVVNQKKLMKEIARIEAETTRTYAEIAKMEAETAQIWVGVIKGRLEIIATMREMAGQLEREEVRTLVANTFDAEPVAGHRDRLLTGPREDHEP